LFFPIVNINIGLRRIQGNGCGRARPSSRRSLDEKIETVLYFPYPRLDIAKDSITLLGASLTHLSLSEFTQLDRDWAIAASSNTTPIVLRIPLTDPGPDHDYKLAATPEAWRVLLNSRLEQMRDISHRGLQTAMLLYNCILAVTAEEYPDPRICRYYVRRREEVCSWGGILGGNTYLNYDCCPPLGPETLSKIATLSELWQSKGFAHTSPVFGPLRALSLSRSASLSEESVTLALMVALEGYVLRKKTRGIAQNLARNCRILLGSAAPSHIEELVNEIYVLQRPRSRTIEHFCFEFLGVHSFSATHRGHCARRC
jgi:hypothetical protein